MKFTLEASDGAARAGRLVLTHGVIETPIFMPVGTHAKVEGMIPGVIEASPNGPAETGESWPDCLTTRASLRAVRQPCTGQ